MARKKKKGPPTRRKSSVGARKAKAGGGAVLGTLVMGIVGGVAVKLASDKLIPGWNPYLKGGIQLALGGITAYAGRRSPLAIGAGIGIAVVGGETIFRGVGLIAGPTYYVPRPKMLAGPGVKQMVAGEGVTQTVAGPRNVTQSVAGRYNRYYAGA